MKKALSILLSLLLLLSLTACGAKAESPAMDMSVSAPQMNESAAGGWYDAKTEETIEMEMDFDMPAEEPMEPEAAPAPEAGEGVSAGSTETMAEKIIYSASLRMESTEFDKTINTIDQMIEQYGGYILSSNISGDTIYNPDGTTTVVDRYAWYTVSIPTEHFETFLTESGNAGNITDTSRYAENVTSAYTDTEARLESLHTQEDRLMAMMQETGDLESLIALEARLAEVTYEIESYQRQLNNWDRRIAYSTVDIELNEVSIYTPTVPVTRTFGEKLADAFSDGWRYFVRGLQNFILWFAESLPALIVWALVITGAVLLLRKLRKHRKAAKAAKQQKKQENSPSEDEFPR